MGLSRSTYYDEPSGQPIEEARLVERIKEICAEWPSYGYRRVTAQLHAEGILANHKKVMQLKEMPLFNWRASRLHQGFFLHSRSRAADQEICLSRDLRHRHHRHS